MGTTMGKGPKDQRRPRIDEIRVDFGREVILSGLEAPGSGEIIFYDENGAPIAPVHIETGLAYDRPKGLKVLSRSTALPTSIPSDPNRNLLQFQTVLAVDTNYKETPEGVISVTTIIAITDIKIDDQRWSANGHPQLALEAFNLGKDPERFGWCHAISRIQKASLPEPVAIIVDAYLGRLPDINARREPILPGFYLPEGFTLIYASADAGSTEQIACAVIAQCDRDARAIQRLSEEHPDEHWVDGKPDNPFVRARYWASSDKGKSWSFEPPDERRSGAEE